MLLLRGASSSIKLSRLRQAFCRGVEAPDRLARPLSSLSPSMSMSTPSPLLPSTTPPTTTRRTLVSTAAVASSSSSGGQRAFLPVPVKIVHVSSRCPLHDSVVDEWLEKARRHAKRGVDDVRLPVNPKNLRGGDVDGIRKSEGERVLRALSPLDFVVLLDERGKAMSSEKLADLVAEAGERLGGGVGGGPSSSSSPASSLAFVIGGPFGHSPAILERADERITLSPMVLNHAVARIVLAEALYRSYAILRGVPYHH